MERRSYILLASLTGNLVLFILCAPKTQSPLRADPQHTEKPEIESPSTSPIADPEHGDSLENVENELLKLKLPENLMRPAIRAAVQRAHHKERQSLFDGASAWRYWRTDPPSPIFELALRRKSRELDRQINSEVRQAFEAVGIGNASSARRAEQLSRYGQVPQQKASIVDEIEIDYNEMLTEIRDKTSGILLPEDQAAIELLQEEKMRDISGILNAEELTQYKLHASPAAIALRKTLGAFHATDEELSLILPSFTDLPLQSVTTDTVDRMLQGVLDPPRYEQYKMESHRSYKATNDFLLRKGVDQSVVELVMKIRLRAEADQTKASDGATAAAIEAQAREAASQILGTEMLGQYIKETGDFAKPK